MPPLGPNSSFYDNMFISFLCLSLCVIPSPIRCTVPRAWPRYRSGVPCILIYPSLPSACFSMGTRSCPGKHLRLGVYKMMTCWRCCWSNGAIKMDRTESCGEVLAPQRLVGSWMACNCYRTLCKWWSLVQMGGGRGR